VADLQQTRGALVQDVAVQVIDVVNASKTLKEQTDLLLGNENKDKAAEIEDVPVQAGIRPDEYKYTVKDGGGRAAFLISTEVWHPGAELLVARGTATWRSVLIPKHGDVRCTRQGRTPTRNELLERLKRRNT